MAGIHRQGDGMLGKRHSAFVEIVVSCCFLTDAMAVLSPAKMICHIVSKQKHFIQYCSVGKWLYWESTATSERNLSLDERESLSYLISQVRRAGNWPLSTLV